jgi:hypothetical protein
MFATRTLSRCDGFPVEYATPRPNHPCCSNKSMVSGARASRSKCTASRVPVNPAPTMAIRGVAVAGARIVRDACIVCSEAFPFSHCGSHCSSRFGVRCEARRRRISGHIAWSGDCKTWTILLGVRTRIPAIRTKSLPFRVLRVNATHAPVMSAC